ncbi:hypothetical protein FVE85_4925 [Porphyridium purpureum]|uniref:MsrB domain-containing protein n=1 Tax=Porphyridium purpureum TaxID=35688 RepID=A0A5J4YR86_PORPP|nr:hypothetical protein FVE85_4925 [Porphyridium purpureum]|eukprot:POR0552..scf236_6
MSSLAKQTTKGLGGSMRELGALLLDEPVPDIEEKKGPVLKPAPSEFHSLKAGHADEKALKHLVRPADLDPSKVWATKGTWATILDEKSFDCLRNYKMGRPFDHEFQLLNKRVTHGIFCCKGCGQELFKVSDLDEVLTKEHGFPVFPEGAIHGSVEKKYSGNDAAELLIFCQKCDGFIGRTRAMGWADDGTVSKITTCTAHSLKLVPVNSEREEVILAKKTSGTLAKRESGRFVGGGVLSPKAPGSGRLSGRLSGRIASPPASKAKSSSSGGAPRVTSPVKSPGKASTPVQESTFSKRASARLQDGEHQGLNKLVSSNRAAVPESSLLSPRAKMQQGKKG